MLERLYPKYMMMGGSLQANMKRQGVVFDPATAIFVGLSAVSAMSQVSAAKQQAKATIAEGNIVAANKAKQVAQKTASQRVSFLNSGLTLEGTPMNVMESTFNTGLEDIGQISQNYNRTAKGQIAAGRSAAISSLASSFAGASMPSVGGSVGNFGSDVGAGISSMQNGTGFGLGYDVSGSFRNATNSYKDMSFS